MRIAIDVDDVLCELMQAWLKHYNRWYEGTFIKADMLHWDLARNGLKSPEVYDLLSEDGKEIYEDAEAVEGAQQAVTLIERSGYEVVFVTSAISKTVDAKIEWLERYDFIKKGRSLDPKLVVT